jgi:cyclopropane fatty-acyl-phospholipid synthase-like methyltransferase
MTKELVKFGVAAKDYDSAQDAASHTYMTRDAQLVPTPLIFGDNPYNKDVEKASIILDLGCGIGRNLPWIMANTSASYIGLDPHPDMHKYFWDVQDEKWKDRVTLVKDFTELATALDGKAIDVVVCTFVFQHIGFRPPEGQMNIADITVETRKLTTPSAVWIMYEHDGEEDWIGRWITETGVFPQVYMRNYDRIPELSHRGNHHLILWKER